MVVDFSAFLKVFLIVLVLQLLFLNCCVFYKGSHKCTWCLAVLLVSSWCFVWVLRCLMCYEQINDWLIDWLIEVVGPSPMTMSIFSTPLLNTSSCIHVDLPETLMVGQTLKFNVSTTTGTKNALAYEPQESRAILHLSVCGVRSLKFNYNANPSRGVYQMPVIDWTNGAGCSLRVEHSLIVFKPQGQLFVPYR